ncbi:MAG: hypothetical protein PHX54_11590 [Lentimicrobiaceae bacterium]|nr:hypothetical protein [Lentimicrobiaceae bacterium]
MNTKLFSGYFCFIVNVVKKMMGDFHNSFDFGRFKSVHQFRGGVRRQFKMNDDWGLKYGVPYWIRVIEEDVCLDVYIYLREGGKLIFSGQDALIEGRRDLPYFYRVKWVKDLPCSFVTFNDPSLYKSTEFGAGYLCTKGAWDILKRAVQKIVFDCKLSESDLIFYGASAGGYWALTMATYFPGAVFVVDIPQVNLETYFSDDKKKHFVSTYESPAKLPCVFDYWEIGKYPKNIYYLQNRRDYFHIRTQYSFFLKGIGELAERGVYSGGDLKVIFYDTPEGTRGHTPLPQDMTISLLRDISSQRAV